MDKDKHPPRAHAKGYPSNNSNNINAVGNSAGINSAVKGGGNNNNYQNNGSNSNSNYADKSPDSRSYTSSQEDP